MKKINIYSVSDRYIAYLRKDKNLQEVYSNKEGERIHKRKYLGIAIKLNEMNYYIPFSSPKKSDYVKNKTGNFDIRNDTISIIRMKEKNKKNGNMEIKGTLRLSNMIPVPDSELELYDVKKEPHRDYRVIVSKEYQFIKRNFEYITKYANILYNQKTKENEIYKEKSKPAYLDNTIDFVYAEQKCKEFVLLVEKEKIVKDVEKHGFIPSKTLIENIEKFNKQLEKNHSFLEINEIHKSKTKLPEETQETLNEIVKECRMQELEKLQQQEKEVSQPEPETCD